MAGGGGRIRQFQLTLDGSAQQLSSAFASDQTLVGKAEGDPTCQWIKVQADDGNSNPVYLGADNLVSAANHAIRIETPATANPEDPETIDGPLCPSSLWVLGTNNEKLNILAAVG